MKKWMEMLSLSGRSAIYQFVLAVAMISIIPLLALMYLLRESGFYDQDISGGLVALLPIAAMVILGYLVIFKYPFTVTRLQRYLKEVVEGELPERIDLLDHEADIGSIEQSLNVILKGLRERMDVMRQEKAHLETELHQAQRLRAMGEISAGIAHEINTPIQFVTDNMRFLSKATTDLLHYVSLASAALKEHPAGAGAPDSVAAARDAKKKQDLAFLEKEIAGAVAQSLEGLEQVASIARAMHDLAHMGSPGEKSPVDINTIARSAMTVARNEWKYVAEVAYDLDPLLPPVPCYRGDISQVLLNLITNAAQAIEDVVGNSGKKGKITLSTRQDGTSAFITVRDTGTGIPEAVRPQIFELFFTTKKAGEGSGQGLSIARTLIVKKHGGDLTFETEIGTGTAFTICLPLKK